MGIDELTMGIDELTMGIDELTMGIVMLCCANSGISIAISTNKDPAAMMLETTNALNYFM